MLDSDSDRGVRASSPVRSARVSSGMSASDSTATLAPSSSAAASALAPPAGLTRVASAPHCLGAPVLGPSRSAPLLHAPPGPLFSAPRQPGHGVSRWPSCASSRPQSAPVRRPLPQHRVSQAFEVHVVKSYKSNQSVPFTLQPLERWSGDLQPHQRGHLSLASFAKASPRKPAPRRLFQNSSPALDPQRAFSGGALTHRAVTRCLSFGTDPPLGGPGWSFRPDPRGAQTVATLDLGAPVSHGRSAARQRLSAPKLLQQQLTRAPSSDSGASASTSSFPLRLASGDALTEVARCSADGFRSFQLRSGHLVPSPPRGAQWAEGGGTPLPPMQVLTNADLREQPHATPVSAPTASPPRTPDPEWSAPTRLVSASDLPQWHWPEGGAAALQTSADAGEKPKATEAPSSPLTGPCPDPVPAD